VREATRRRVEQAIAATGWAADPAARQLAGGAGDEVVLAIAVADRREFANDPYYARVIAGAHEEAARHGLSVSLCVAPPRLLAGLRAATEPVLPRAAGRLPVMRSRRGIA